MNIFDAMKGIATGELQWAQLELPDGFIRMELDPAGNLTKRVRQHGDDRFHRAAFQRLSRSEYEADWSILSRTEDAP